MAEPKTWFKVYRSIDKWRWWFEHDVVCVFLWSIGRANVTEHEFEDMTIHRGEFVTSYDHMAAACGVTYKRARTITNKLKTGGEWAVKRIPKGLVITVCNYSKYQGTGTQWAPNGHETGTQWARNGQQYKNDNNDKNGENNARARATRPAYANDDDIDELLNELFPEGDEND